MRTIPIGEQKISVRGLTGKEVKELKAAGIPISRMGMDMVALSGNLDLAEDSMNRVLGVMLTDDQQIMLDEMPNGETIKVWNGILKETFGAPDETKNS